MSDRKFVTTPIDPRDTLDTRSAGGSPWVLLWVIGVVVVVFVLVLVLDRYIKPSRIERHQAEIKRCAAIGGQATLNWAADGFWVLESCRLR